VAEATPGQAPAQPAIPESLNPHEASALLAQMLEAEDKTDAQPRDDKGKFAKPETQQTPEKAETPPGEAKAEETAPAEETPEITPEVRRFKLKYKGEELEKEEPEVIALAQQGFDYTQKSQALAKEREELALKVKTEVEQRQKHYEEQLEVYKQSVLKLADPEALSADLNKLSETDPVKAQQLFFKRLEINQALQAVQAEQQKIAQAKQVEFQGALEKQAKEAVETLQTKIPGWSTDLYGKILKTGIDSYGFKQQEVNAITDPRAIEVLNDARQWREYLAAKPKTVDKKVPPVAPKVQKPGAGDSTEPKANKIQEGMARLSKSGSRTDAVDLVREMIDQGKL
jgi:hypothetical protein